MNSRDKGKRGEREFASFLREHGFDARRGQQFSGSPDSPDVVSEALAWLHIEVKRVQNLNLADACAQAERDSKRATATPHPVSLSPVEAEREKKCGGAGKPWIVAHRRNHAPWLITMRAEFFCELVREFEPCSSGATPEPTRPSSAVALLRRADETRVLPQTDRTDGTQGTDDSTHGGASRTGDERPTNKEFPGVTPENTRETRVLQRTTEQTKQTET